MSFRRDFIMDQIEKACEVLAALLLKGKVDTDDQLEIDQILSGITGLGIAFLGDPANARSLSVLLNALEDENKKVVAALLLLAKDEELYADTCDAILAKVNYASLDSRTKKMLKDYY